MDGPGRAMDNIFVKRLWRNVNYEDIYLNDYASMPELMLGLTTYFVFYNGERPHQALDYRTPNMVNVTATGGGKLIVDKYGGAGKESTVPRCSKADVLPTKTTSTAAVKPEQRRAAILEEESTS